MKPELLQREGQKTISVGTLIWVTSVPIDPYGSRGGSSNAAADRGPRDESTYLIRRINSPRDIALPIVNDGPMAARVGHHHGDQ